MDRVAKVVSTAAFHDRERETDPMALETAETLVVEANCLYLPPFTYCVDDATVPDTHLRTLIGLSKFVSSTRNLNFLSCELVSLISRLSQNHLITTAMKSSLRNRMSKAL